MPSKKKKKQKGKGKGKEKDSKREEKKPQGAKGGGTPRPKAGGKSEDDNGGQKAAVTPVQTQPVEAHGRSSAAASPEPAEATQAKERRSLPGPSSSSLRTQEELQLVHAQLPEQKHETSQKSSEPAKKSKGVKPKLRHTTEQHEKHQLPSSGPEQIPTTARTEEDLPQVAGRLQKAARPAEKDSPSSPGASSRLPETKKGLQVDPHLSEQPSQSSFSEQSRKSKVGKKTQILPFSPEPQERRQLPSFDSQSPEVTRSEEGEPEGSGEGEPGGSGEGEPEGSGEGEPGGSGEGEPGGSGEGEPEGSGEGEPGGSGKGEPEGSGEGEPGGSGEGEPGGAGLRLGPRKEHLFRAVRRPDHGRFGKSISLVANYFLLNYSDVIVYHYDVDIFFRSRSILEKGKTVKKKDDEKQANQKTKKRDKTHVEEQMKRVPGKERCRQIIAEAIRSEAFKDYNPVYDSQKNIYTTKRLPFDGKRTISIHLTEGKCISEFDVVIKPVWKEGGGNAISMEPLIRMYAGETIDVPQEILMVLDTVMTHRNPPLTQLRVGRSFYRLQQRAVGIRGDQSKEMRFGYNQSVHLTEKGPAVVVNYSAKAFHKGMPVIDYAEVLLRKNIKTLPRLRNEDLEQLKKHLGKIKIQVTHLGYLKKYTVRTVKNESPRELRVSDRETGNRVREKTVAEYYREKYQLNLRYPNLPCLSMERKKETFIPMELCVICPNQPVLESQQPEELSSIMIRETAMRPPLRFQKIREKVDEIDEVSGQIMNSFGLQMNHSFLETVGRVLSSPALTYGHGPKGVVYPEEKSGTWKMQGKKFLKSGGECKWVLISFVDCDMEVLRHLEDTLCQCARKSGMNLPSASAVRIFDHEVSTFNALKYAKDEGSKFAFVVFSKRDKNFHPYDEIKFVGDVQLSLITQCMDSSIVARAFDVDYTGRNKLNPQQVATNVLLKLNAKTGGINHSILHTDGIFERTIVMGADATHSPRGDICPSIASVVGSLDRYAARYAVVCRTQENPDDKKISQEIILDMKEMVKRILQEFLKSSKEYPEKILFFRDGVSEGQFQTVLDEEVPMVQEAFRDTLRGNVPRLTFLIVQKRHQTRLLPSDPKEGLITRSGNVPAGTVVDRDITHPINFDFFLCSHEGIQGTSRPAHYTVIHDENEFTSDKLQKLCHNLCHTYVRCNRSISIPAPVKYADMACERARMYAKLCLKREELKRKELERKEREERESGGSRQKKMRLPQEAEDAINNMCSFQPGMFFV